MKEICIVLDGPPGHHPEIGKSAGRFVEVECDGKSFKAGEWRPTGQFWELVLDMDLLIEKHRQNS